MSKMFRSDGRKEYRRKWTDEELAELEARQRVSPGKVSRSMYMTSRPDDDRLGASWDARAQEGAADAGGPRRRWAERDLDESALFGMTPSRPVDGPMLGTGPEAMKQVMWQRDATRTGPPRAGAVLQGKGMDELPTSEIRVEATGSGELLPEEVRAKMEAALSMDFSGVRIHVGAQAASVGALAFTRGLDIFFAPGRYQPESRAGQELLGHELTHVVQQAQGRVGASKDVGGVGVNDDVGLEAEADAMGAKAARGERIGGPVAEAKDGVRVAPRTSTTARQMPRDVSTEPQFRQKPALKSLCPELTHVVQQSEGRAGVSTDVGGVGVNDDPGLEREADETGTSATYAKVRTARPASLLASTRMTTGLTAPLQAQTGDDGSSRTLKDTPVRRFGIAYKKEGVNLRDQPASNSKVKKLLLFNTRMFVDSEESGYYLVTTDAGDFGYVRTTHVNTNLPEPSAKIYYIESGDTALGISHKHYGGKAEWGRDHKFFVNGLVFVNDGSGARGVYKPHKDADWDKTEVRAGYKIWVPSLPFMRSLEGQIKSGSITGKAWQTVKKTAQAVGEFLLGTGAFIAGLLHGALESLWDILVGLKDLAVMAWDVLKSLFTGNLLSDAKGLWGNLSGLDWGALVQGWLDKFAAKWNHDDLMTKWHFRGWVFGYVIAEVVMLVLSGGLIQGIKWVGKSAKVAKAIQKFPRIARFAKTVKESKAAQKLIQSISKGGGTASRSIKAAKAFVKGLLDKPRSIWGKGPDEIAEAFRKAGYEVSVQQSTKGSKLSKQIRIKGHKDIANIQVHPGGGRHGGSYYKISSSTRGKIKVVNRKTYKPTPGEKATIIYADSGPSGWLLRATIANSAAQKAKNSGD